MGHEYTNIYCKKKTHAEEIVIFDEVVFDSVALCPKDLYRNSRAHSGVSRLFREQTSRRDLSSERILIDFDKGSLTRIPFAGLLLTSEFMEREFVK